MRPLKLKIQRVSAPSGPAATDKPVALVWVDSGIPTLVEPFSYLIPAKLSEQITIGSRVQVPFKEKQLEGLVISREPISAAVHELKAIYKVLGDYPVANLETIELIQLVASYWGGCPYDVIRSAIPPRVANVEKNLNLANVETLISRSCTATFHLLPPKQEPISALMQLINTSKRTGSKLILVPTQRELNRLQRKLHQAGQQFISLDSTLPRAERYLNFLSATAAVNQLIIGMRAAIFAPIPNLAEIYLHRENSEHYYERRAPYWNAREVAWIRSKSANIDLHMTGYLPSLDVGVDIEAKEIKYEAVRERVAVLAQPSSAGELIPTKIYQLIRNSLKNGPVLFLVPAKGYATAISCAKCRNAAICECGGKLTKASAKSDPVCVICAKRFINWRCGWCNDARIFLTSRGIDRFAEEIGRSFPNIRVIQSSASDPIEEVGSDPAIVISTAGVEPIALSGYQSVVILQVDRFLAATATNGAEQALSNFFAASALISETGTVALVGEDGSAITSALATWNPATFAKREIELRTELKLPPITSSIIMTGSNVELSRVKRALQTAVEESRAPSSLRVYGPSNENNEFARLTLLMEPIQQLEVVALLREINKRRAISKKSAIGFQVNPFSID